jgi:hypothetical protein
VALVRTDVSEDRITSIIRVAIIGELGRRLAVNNNRRKLRINILCDIVFLLSAPQLLITANVVPSLPILVNLMMEAIRSS